MKEKSLLAKIWNVIWPLFIYVIAQNVTTILGVLLLPNKEPDMYYKYAVVFLLTAAIVCIPIYYRMYKKDCLLAEEEKKGVPMGLKDYAAIIISGAALAVAMNNIIAITPLPHIFKGYEETNEVLFGGGMVLQILSAGILGCVVEELSMRGVSYGRMKRYWGKKRAMILSALVFGIYHMNVVQGVYTFVLGLFFVWVYERYESLWASIIAHMSANLFVILLGSTDFVTHLLETMVGYCLMTCISILVFSYIYQWMKQTNPLIELEFVEKEPDTLKGLTEEYKEQEREEH